jgi:uncharacterized protein (TIGR00297 family)
MGYGLALGVGVAARRLRALTSGGALGAGLVGGTVFALGPASASAGLLTFFLSSSLLTRLPGAREARDAGGRTAGQVVANGGVAAVLSLLYACRPAGGTLAAIGGALAAATADTWATEVGTRYGGTPRLITSGRTVPTGTDGGVTVAGTAATVAGALGLSLVYAAASGDEIGRFRLAGSCALGGVAGSLLDSVLGATVEVGPGGGVHWLRNDEVNALNTLAGAVVAGLLAGAPGPRAGTPPHPAPSPAAVPPVGR